MFESCRVCGRKDDLVFYRVDSKNNYSVTCRRCHKGKNTTVHDVWYGYGSGTHIEENICDPETGRPIPFSSKNGKWEAMQRAKVCEVGDRVRGARTTFTGSRHS